MKNMIWLLWSMVLVAGVFLVSVPSAAAEQELIVNGGFEIGPDSGPGHTRLDPESHALHGWTVVRGSIDYAGSDWISPDGTHCLDLEGEAAFGGISQSISTVPGQVYAVRFDLAGNTDCDPKVKKMRVLAAGQLTERWFDTTGRSHDNLGWQTHEWQFLATGDTTDIEFISVGDGPGHCGPMLDNVSVMASAQPWGVRKRFTQPEAALPSKEAVSVEGELTLNMPISIKLNAGADDRADVVRLESVKFVLDDGWLRAQVSAKLLSWPKGKWRLVVELLDASKNVTLRRDITFENSGIIMGRAGIEDRVFTIDLGPYQLPPDRSAPMDIKALPTMFRLSIEGVPLRPDSQNTQRGGCPAAA